MRTYELTFVLDPRLPDEQTQAMCDEYGQMIEGAGGRIEHREDWGKRQLAYPIGRLEEGRYFLWHLSCEDGNPTVEVEYRMRQREEVLRFLTVRTEALDFAAREAAPAASETAVVSAAAETSTAETPAVDTNEESAAASDRADGEKPTAAAAEGVGEDETPSEEDER